jgi:hypothetical protein
MGILEDLTSPRWLFSVVLIGVAVNIVSAYLKPAMDRRFGEWSSRFAHRLEQRDAAFKVEVERWRARDDASVVLRLDRVELLVRESLWRGGSFVAAYFGGNWSGGDRPWPSRMMAATMVFCLIVSTVQGLRRSKLERLIGVLERESERERTQAS